MLVPNLEANAAGHAVGGVHAGTGGAAAAADVGAAGGAAGGAGGVNTVQAEAGGVNTEHATLEAGDVMTDAWPGALRVGSGSAAAAALNWYRPIDEQIDEQEGIRAGGRLDPRDADVILAYP